MDRKSILLSSNREAVIAEICLSMQILALISTATLFAFAASPQSTKNPFPEPIVATEGVISVHFREFAAIPYEGDEAPRLMLLVNEPGTRRLFVNTMRGAIYSISYDGKTVTPYLDVNAPAWGINVQSSSHDRGFQSFAFHPQFNQRGKPGFGKFYTYTDSSNLTRKADFLPNGPGHSHDTVLLEWTADHPEAATYHGKPPREIFRTAKPFVIHNGGQIAFNSLAKLGDPDFGLLYVGVADGGTGGDPYKHAQNLAYAFGKILRIDPLGTDSRNGQYGIPPSNPFVKNAKPGTRGEIYAYGCRNPQRFSWDARNGKMYLADIGQDVIEKITLVTPGANLGWNIWEGSFKYGVGQVETETPRGDPAVTFPIVEFDHTDPLFLPVVAITGVFAYRGNAVKQLTDKLIFGDNPSGELFYVDADNLPHGGQDAIRRILFDDHGTIKTLLQLIQDKNKSQGKRPAKRADMRLNLGPDGEIFVLNKADGTIRQLLP